MRTALTFLLFTIAISIILVLKITSENALVEPKYVGAGKCKGCHSVLGRGNQYEIWKESKHSKAFLVLKEERSIKYAKHENIPIPIENPKCLKCHTTAYNLKPENFVPSFDKSEGIQCEQCHNAASEYYKYDIMAGSKDIFIKKGGAIGSTIECMKCHSPNITNPKFNKCPFQKENFSSEAGYQKIKHPITK